jgi:molybdopterin-guanine dinucleotide biosynthesis protein
VLVGIHGFKGSGKTTLAKRLQDSFLAYSTCKMGFADPIKWIAVELLGLDKKAVYGTDEEKNAVTRFVRRGKPMTVRQVLQMVGQVGRMLDENLWVDTLLRRVVETPADLILVDDVRFPNEVEAIKNAGGKVIKLLRGGSDDPHISERALIGYEGFDLVVPDLHAGETEQYVFSWLSPALGEQREYQVTHPRLG